MHFVTRAETVKHSRQQAVLLVVTVRRPWRGRSGLHSQAAPTARSSEPVVSLVTPVEITLHVDNREPKFS